MNEQEKRKFESHSLMEEIWRAAITKEGDLLSLAYWTYLYKRDVDPNFPYDHRCRPRHIQIAETQADQNARYGTQELETVVRYQATIDSWDQKIQSLANQYLSLWADDFDLLGVTQNSSRRQIKKSYEERVVFLEKIIEAAKREAEHLESTEMFDSYFATIQVLEVRQKLLSRLVAAYSQVISD